MLFLKKKGGEKWRECSTAYEKSWKSLKSFRGDQQLKSNVSSNWNLTKLELHHNSSNTPSKHNALSVTDEFIMILWREWILWLMTSFWKDHWWRRCLSTEFSVGDISVTLLRNRFTCNYKFCVFEFSLKILSSSRKLGYSLKWNLLLYFHWSCVLHFFVLSQMINVYFVFDDSKISQETKIIHVTQIFLKKILTEYVHLIPTDKALDDALNNSVVNNTNLEQIRINRFLTVKKNY